MSIRPAISGEKQKIWDLKRLYLHLQLRRTILRYIGVIQYCAEIYWWGTYVFGEYTSYTFAIHMRSNYKYIKTEV